MVWFNLVRSIEWVLILVLFAKCHILFNEIIFISGKTLVCVRNYFGYLNHYNTLWWTQFIRWKLNDKVINLFLKLIVSRDQVTFDISTCTRYIETPQSQAMSINHWKNHNPKTYRVRPQVFIMPQLFKCLYIILLHLMCSNTATFSVFANLLCFRLSNAAALYVLTMLVHSWVVSWFASP